MNTTQILIDECNEYLDLTDEQLRGYGINRATLQYQLDMLKDELEIDKELDAEQADM